MTLVVILYALYLTGGSKDAQAKQKKVCQKNLQNAYMALKTYSIDHLERFPTTLDTPTSEPALSLLIPQSTTRTEFFVCPGTKDKVPPPAKPFAGAKISYAYYMGRIATQGSRIPLMSDEQVNVNGKNTGQPLFSPDGKGLGNNHDKYGGVILFCDGSTQVCGTNASMPLPLGPGVTLLNPKP